MTSPRMTAFDPERTSVRKFLRMEMLLRLIRLHAIPACGLLAALAQAQDLESVKAPYVEVGECWTYATKGEYRRGWIQSIRECVTHIDRQKNVVICVATLQPTGEEVETVYTLTWGMVVDISGRINRPPVELRFPLRVGETYEVTNEYYDNPFGESGAGKTTRTVKIVGWEDVTVPAGRFRALRIETVGTWESKDGGSGTVKTTSWHAPAVNRDVKQIVDAWTNQKPIDHRERELLKTEFNP